MLRGFTRFIFGILILLLAVFAALQLPATQHFLARKAVSIAKEQLGTDLGIGKVKIDFFSSLSLQDVYLNNPAGDSIARIGNLHLGINFYRLFNKTVAISDVSLTDVFANIKTTDSTSNIQFLLDQFVVVDSTEEISAAADTTANPWKITANHATLQLARADIFYQDDPTGLLLDLQAQRLSAKTNQLDLEKQVYDLNYLDLQSSQVVFRQQSWLDTLPIDSTANLDMQLLAGRVTLKDIVADVKLDEMALMIEVPYANLEGGDLRLSSTIAGYFEVFQLQNAAFSLDQPVAELPGPGLDYNHLALTDITAEATEIAYVGDSLDLMIRQLTAKEKSGLHLQRTEGKVTYTPNLLALENFLLRTSHTEINSAGTRVNYAFTENTDPATLAAQIELNGYVGLADVALLVPDLLSIQVVKNNLKQRLDFTAKAAGTGKNVKIGLLKLDGPGIKLRATGNVDYPFDANQLAAKANILELNVVPGPLLPLLPNGMVPPGIDWPRRIVAEGTIDYRDDAVDLNLFALEDRPNPLDLSSRVRINGIYSGLTTFPRSRVSIELDTVLATRTSILAYLPPNTLPPGYRLPDFVRGSGSVRGPLDGKLDVNLRINLPGETTFATIQGSVDQVMDPNKLSLDLEVKDLAIATFDIKQLLPDSLLPANFNLPELRVRNARVQGTLANLDFELPLETSNGNWNLSGKYNPNDLKVTADLDNFVLADLFTGALRDSLQTLQLEPLDLQATIVGQLEPTMNLVITATAQEQQRGQLLDLEALVEGSTYSGDFRITHPDFMAEGSGLYSIGEDSVTTVFADLELDRIDLQRWDITEVPLFVSGHLTTDVTGLDPYNMQGKLLLDDVLLRGADGSSFVDSFSVTAQLLNEENEILVRSDLLDATVKGIFDPLALPDELLRFLRGYWEEDIAQPDPLQSGRFLEANFNLKRTRPLTGGLIAGLEEISPFTAEFSYRDRNPGLMAKINLPRLVYAGTELDNLVVDAEGDVDRLDFSADFANVNFNNQLVLGRTRISGDNRDGGLLTELRVWNEKDSLRHYFGFVIDPETDSLTVAMTEKQRINYQTWSVPANNLISLAGTSLIIRNWALVNGEQRISAETTEPGDVEIKLANFDLATVSSLLNSEAQLVGGIVNGRVGLDNAITNLGINTNLNINKTTYLETPLGDVKAVVTTNNEQNYQINLDLEGAGNRAYVDGTYELNGTMNLVANLEKLTLQSAEPFSLGYLKDAEGYLTGQLTLTGTPTAPRIQGNARFKEAAARISILGEKFQISEEPIKFSGSTIRIPSLSFIDSRGEKATMRGTVEMEAIDDIRLDLRADATNFLALNSTKKDNPLYYGKMAVNADVVISGTADLPVLVINAGPASASEVTYVYTVAQNRDLVGAEGIVTFVDQVEWSNVLRNDTIQDTLSVRKETGIDLTLNLNVDPKLTIKVIVDPISGQTFTGRANGNLTLRQFPDFRQEMVGRVEMVDGTYDFSYQNALKRKFKVMAGSNVVFNGDVLNPQLDLRIRHEVRTQPLPLVTALDPEADATGLKRKQTFYVAINLKGDLQSSNINTDVIYPEDATGNLGLSSVTNALARLRQDESRITTTAFSLLAFQSFNIPLLDTQEGGVGIEQTTMDRIMSQTLNNLANKAIGFVELDFGVESYENSEGEVNTNLRLSLSKSLFNDRLIVSVDGVTNSGEDDADANGQSYLDNITAEYLINEDGSLRLKFFNDRDRDVLVGGNVIRFGGRVTFAKDFEKLNWFSKDN